MQSVYSQIQPFIAHRGASGQAPENTEAAIRIAAEQGAKWVEVDVALSSDQQAIIFHDYRLNRCTNGSGPIIKQTVADLKQLDAGSWFSPFFTNEPILTLAELLRIAEELKLNLNLEIKPVIGFEKETVTATQKVLATSPFSQSLLISSFNMLALQEACALMPNIERGLNLEAIPIDWQQRLEVCQASGLHFDIDFFNSSQVEAIAKTGTPLLCFTVNDPEVAAPLFSAGVTGVFTDYPDRF